MATRLVPAPSVVGADAVAASADQAATQAALAVFDRGGNAVDAAIAANAVLAVTAPHLCGMGGDLFALVHDGSRVHALDASGRAGSGADAARLRDSGVTSMPFRHHPAAVTIPGCVDGWAALHGRFGSLPLEDLLDRAATVATAGFPASPLLTYSLGAIDERSRANLHELAGQAAKPGAIVRRPGAAAALRAIGERGRDAFYCGAFGEGLLGVTAGWITADDLERRQADWVTPLTADAFGVTLHTIPPCSQGYLLLGGALAAERLGVPDDADADEWLSTMVHAAVLAGYDRPDVLHDEADGEALLARIAERATSTRGREWPDRFAPAASGDTTFLCTAQRGGLAVSLIQSNASGFGSGLVESATSINLQNRGIGFSLAAGHPAELRPGRRPPHTLSPAMSTRGGGLHAVFGTMGGDAQPQILLQLAARLCIHGESVASAVAAPRWALRGQQTGFDTWDGVAAPELVIEGHAPPSWQTAPGGLSIRTAAAYTSEVGHAHAIVDDGSVLHAAADPRAVIGSAAGC